MLIVYILSWPLWIGEVKEKTHFITGEKVRTYSYFNSKSQLIHFIVKSFIFSKDDFIFPSDEDEEGIFIFAHSLYRPLEFVASSFDFQFIGEFYRDNLKDLKEFNSSSDVKKSDMYKNFNKYYPFFLYSERFLQFQEYLDTNHYNQFRYEAKSLLIEEFENLFVKETEKDYYRTNHKFQSYERLYYSFAEYKVILLESDRFANWFNGINVRTSNTNFDPELARKYKSFIINLENPKEPD